MTSSNDTLLGLVKNILKITWEDEDTELSVSSLTNDAILWMNHRLGSSDIDYTEPGIYRMLFLNYCLYAYNGVPNEFEPEYIRELNQARAMIILASEDDNEGV